MSKHETRIALKKAQYTSELNDLKVEVDSIKQQSRSNIKILVVKASPILLGFIGLLKGNKKVGSMFFKYIKYNVFPKYFGNFIKLNIASRFLSKKLD